MGNNYIYRKGGTATTVQKLLKTLNINGVIESVREIKRFLRGYRDDEKLSDIITSVEAKIPEAIESMTLDETNGDIVIEYEK